jgi:hypothetical protein
MSKKIVRRRYVTVVTLFLVLISCLLVAYCMNMPNPKYRIEMERDR